MRNLRIRERYWTVTLTYLYNSHTIANESPSAPFRHKHCTVFVKHCTYTLDRLNYFDTNQYNHKISRSTLT